MYYIRYFEIYELYLASFLAIYKVLVPKFLPNMEYELIKTYNNL